MLRKFIVVNVAGIVYHIIFGFSLIKTIALFAGPLDWFLMANKFAYYYSYVALIPNVVYLISNIIKRQKEKGIVKEIMKAFFISSLMVVGSYFVIANLWGYFYHEIIG